jgi:hypothetical protein
MEEWSEKEKVMKQKGKLREKKETEKIFIDNDLTKQEREIQKKLRTIGKEERRQGKEVNVRYRKIITIEGVQWRWNEERERLEVGGGMWDGETRDKGNGKRTTKKVDGQRKWNPEKKHKGKHKREDRKGRIQVKKATKTTKVRVLYWNVAG